MDFIMADGNIEQLIEGLEQEEIKLSQQPEQMSDADLFQRLALFEKAIAGRITARHSRFSKT